MGTRSLTKVIQTWEDKDKIEISQTITCMYRQYDGHIEGHGKELVEWLHGYSVVNSISTNKLGPAFNGMDCLAAQMFAHFKNETGGIYCLHPDTKGCGEEYLYEIENGVIDGKETIFITVYEEPPIGYDGWVEIFHGTPDQLLIQLTINEDNKAERKIL